MAKMMTLEESDKLSNKEIEKHFEGVRMSIGTGSDYDLRLVEFDKLIAAHFEVYKQFT